MFSFRYTNYIQDFYNNNAEQHFCGWYDCFETIFGLHSFGTIFHNDFNRRSFVGNLHVKLTHRVENTVPSHRENKSNRAAKKQCF